MIGMLTQNNNKHDIDPVTIKNGTETIGRIWSSTNDDWGKITEHNFK